MAPHSDVDIAFITPGKQTGLGRAGDRGDALSTCGTSGSRSAIRAARSTRWCGWPRADLTIRTAMLEGRYVWGDQTLYDEAVARFWTRSRRRHRGAVRLREARRAQRAAQAHGRQPLCRRAQRQGRQGRPARPPDALSGSASTSTACSDPAELVDVGLLTPHEFRSFRRAENFLLGGALPPAHDHRARRGPADLRPPARGRRGGCISPTGPGKSAVERFMQYYFLQAKHVGDLTGVFLAHLDEQIGQARSPRGLLATFRARPRELERLPALRAAGSPRRATTGSQQDPVRLIEMFAARRRARARDPSRRRCAWPRRDAEADRRQGARRSRAPMRCSSSC